MNNSYTMTPSRTLVMREL